MAASCISLIVGLGNPGERYANTRHNAGFQFLDAIAGDLGADLRVESRFSGRLARGVLNSHEVRLFAPETYMNLCGDAVAKLVRFYKTPVDQVLVAYDELDLPPGTVRLKIGGGHGGHNGLKSLFESLGSRDFVRLRIGIGKPERTARGGNYVLKPPSADEAAAIDEAIQAARTELERIVTGDLGAAMNVLHTLGQKNDGKNNNDDGA